MTSRIFLSVAVVSVIAFAPGSASAQARLAWKFKAGEKLTYTVNQNMVMKVSVEGEEKGASKMTQTMTMNWVIKAVDEAKGTATIGQTISRIQMTMDSPPFGEMKYDSDVDAEPANPVMAVMVKTFDALVGNETIVTMSPTGEITNVVLPEELIEALNKNPAFEKLGGGESLFKEMANKSGFVMPKNEVREGDIWKHKSEMNMPFGKMVMNMDLTYLGNESLAGTAVEKIGIVPDLSVVPTPGSPIQMEMKSSDATGVLFFDNVNGRIVESKMTTKLQLLVNDTFEQNIEQEIVMKLKRG